MSQMTEIHEHLYKRYVTLGQVIEARRVHHKHFYSLRMDYGHQVFLDKLVSNRHIILCLLERLTRRMIQVRFENEKWFSWVRKAQRKTQDERDKEQKKTRQEAAVFRKHAKRLEERLEALREKEEQKRQDADLEQAYQERSSEAASDMAKEDWDPIVDMNQNRRDTYLDLIRHFLWMEATSPERPQIIPVAEDPLPPTKPQEAFDAMRKKKKKKNKNKNKDNTRLRETDAPGSNVAVAPAKLGQLELLALEQSGKLADGKTEPKKSTIESESEMRMRLSQNTTRKAIRVGVDLFLPSQSPPGPIVAAPLMSNEEIEYTVKAMKEIKMFLFCRLVLAQATLLPIALRSSGVEDFLRDPEMTDADLRDLCLQLEEPTLRSIRDACADYCQSEKATTELTICGRRVSDRASDLSMPRIGWVYFSIMTRECDLRLATDLCRSWDEFIDLDLLTHCQFYPCLSWDSWGDNRMTWQLHLLGFYPYFMELSDRVSESQAAKALVGGRGRGKQPEPVKIHVRNIMVAHMKKDNPVTERFLHYITMQSVRLLLLVRDGKQGRIVTTPPADQLWTCREKTGSQTRVLFGVYGNVFDVMDKTRRWRLGFDDYYEVCFWEVFPSRSSGDFHHKTLQVRFHPACLGWFDKEVDLLSILTMTLIATYLGLEDRDAPRLSKPPEASPDLPHEIKRDDVYARAPTQREDSQPLGDNKAASRRSVLGE